MVASRPSTLTLTKPGPLRLFDTTELLRMPPPRWQVEGIIPAGGLVGLYGPPGTGKSFVAIDLAMCIASGRPWHGRAVEPGYAVYISAEGGTGIGKRAAAWLSANQVSGHDVNMGWLTESIPVSSTSEELDVLFERINDEIERNPGIVVIDTLARCFDGDENLQEDMGRFIAGVDRLRREFNATVVVVHHTRLDADRERGSTAFRGAADTMLSIARKKGEALELACNKQKDAEEFDTLTFEMRVVSVEMRGVPDTSCVIVDEAVIRQDRDTAILAHIVENSPISYSALKKWAPRAHISPATLKRGLVSLLGKREIVKKNTDYAIPRAHAKRSEPND